LGHHSELQSLTFNGLQGILSEHLILMPNAGLILVTFKKKNILAFKIWRYFG
jgi:hypothetical protein